MDWSCNVFNLQLIHNTKTGLNTGRLLLKYQTVEMYPKG